jgi:hypothetical protein
MSIQNTSPAARGQAQIIDFFEVRLRKCKVTLDEILKLSPNEPIGPCERVILVQKPGVGWVEGAACRASLRLQREGHAHEPV